MIAVFITVFIMIVAHERIVSREPWRTSLKTAWSAMNVLLIVTVGLLVFAAALFTIVHFLP